MPENAHATCESVSNQHLPVKGFLLHPRHGRGSSADCPGLLLSQSSAFTRDSFMPEASYLHWESALPRRRRLAWGPGHPGVLTSTIPAPCEDELVEIDEASAAEPSSVLTADRSDEMIASTASSSSIAARLPYQTCFLISVGKTQNIGRTERL